MESFFFWLLVVSMPLFFARPFFEKSGYIVLNIMLALLLSLDVFFLSTSIAWSGVVFMVMAVTLGALQIIGRHLPFGYRLVFGIGGVAMAIGLTEEGSEGILPLVAFISARLGEIFNHDAALKGVSTVAMACWAFYGAQHGLWFVVTAQILQMIAVLILFMTPVQPTLGHWLKEQLFQSRISR